LAEQRGSGGEGDDEEEIERPPFRFAGTTKEQLDNYQFRYTRSLEPPLKHACGVA
jgi:hypothetical protein